MHTAYVPEQTGSIYTPNYVICSIYNIGISFTNNDNVFGRVDAVTVDLTSGCNKAEPYETGSFITLVKDGMILLALYQKLILNVISHSLMSVEECPDWLICKYMHCVLHLMINEVTATVHLMINKTGEREREREREREERERDKTLL